MNPKGSINVEHRQIHEHAVANSKATAMPLVIYRTPPVCNNSHVALLAACGLAGDA
jgi:hypothetical protein